MVEKNKTKQNKNKQTNKQKASTFAKISPKLVNPRDKAGNAEEEEEADTRQNFVSKRLQNIND